MKKINSLGLGESENTENPEEILTPAEGDNVPSEEPETPEEPEENIAIICDGFTVDDLVNHYMFGIDLSDNEGNPLPQSLFAAYLNSAIQYAEGIFDICLTKKEIAEEWHDYEMSDYQNWGFIQLFKKPVQSVQSLELMYGSRPSFAVPNDWLKIDKLGGKLQLFPSSGSTNALIITQGGAIFGLHNRFQYAPQMWRVSYTAGMDADEIPAHLKELIYKRATMGVLNVWGDLIIGAGIANQSVSIDGISQSIGTTQSAMFGGASARVEEYRKDIENLIPIIRQQFASMRMVVL